ncbi:MAG: alpha/beta fold hydrolase [Dehalococcoidia bacterium]
MATMSDVSVANDTFWVRLWSAGSGRPLLFLHGFEGHPGEAPFLQRLAETHHVYAPEHPGYGESTGIEHIDDMLDMVLYCRQLVESLGLGELDVVGHSLGGMFAAEFAAICPRHVRRLVLVAPFGLWLNEAPIPDPFTMSPGQFQRALWHNADSPEAQQAVESLANGRTGITATVTRAGNLSAAGKFLWPIPDRGLQKRLPLIKAPTLVVLGGSDKLIGRAYGDAFASRIPDARVTTIPDAGHLPMIEQPDAFMAAVGAFLGR